MHPPAIQTIEGGGSPSLRQEPPPVPIAASRGLCRRWMVLLLMAVAGLGLFWLLRFHEPRGQAFFPQCQFHRFTGLQCPGCGSTRAVHHLFNGRIIDALRSNALLIGFLPVAVVVLGNGFRRWWRGGEFLPYIGGRFVWWVVGMMLAFCVVRNIPTRPFTYLNPPATVSAATPITP